MVFGDVLFKSWYPSWYPKEIIGEKALAGDNKGIVVQTLYVCKRCFAYSKVVEDWVSHCNLCEKEVPGQQVYVHGAGQGVWSVWEVDGGVDTVSFILLIFFYIIMNTWNSSNLCCGQLFCQNLSLFAKLFLDNKSVFFDVSGFNYFLLVHTSPATQDQQIVGFFSKEKMSWDNNNLACILVFPPWQRKNLGSILMGVSYEISRREEILGGPEKPISDLGKKGYKRYWGVEIARWLLEAKETDKKKETGFTTVEQISKETWILGEDCLTVLRDMGVVEKTAHGKNNEERVKIDKVKVRKWVEQQNLSLERVVDPDGFLEGYGYKAADEEAEE